MKDRPEPKFDEGEFVRLKTSDGRLTIEKTQVTRRFWRETGFSHAPGYGLIICGESWCYELSDLDSDQYVDEPALHKLPPEKEEDDAFERFKDKLNLDPITHKEPEEVH